MDGKLVDRRFDTFGFREFWVAGTDFYLNGKRIILQGCVGVRSLNVRNWQTLYSLRPVIFGETLYCSYFVNNKWVGARPELVAKKAAEVREIAGIYRNLEIPCAIYMGVNSDGFAQLDDTGKGVECLLSIVPGFGNEKRAELFPSVYFQNPGK